MFAFHCVGGGGAVYVPDNAEAAGLDVSHELLSAVSVDSLLVVRQLSVRYELWVYPATCVTSTPPYTMHTL